MYIKNNTSKKYSSNDKIKKISWLKKMNFEFVFLDESHKGGTTEKANDMMNYYGENSTHVYTQGDEKVKSDLDKYVDIFVDHVSENIFELFPKKNDAQIADAILELFHKRETLEVFNKKALYIYIREMVDVKTPKITKIADKLHSIFKEQYIFYLENGYARF